MWTEDTTSGFLICIISALVTVYVITWAILAVLR
jgi:hypothetical protein